MNEKRYYNVVFDWPDGEGRYFDYAVMTEAEAQEIRDWLELREALDLVIDPEVFSVKAPAGRDELLQNLEEITCLELRCFTCDKMLSIDEAKKANGYCDACWDGQDKTQAEEVQP